MDDAYVFFRATRTGEFHVSSRVKSFYSFKFFVHAVGMQMFVICTIIFCTCLDSAMVVSFFRLRSIDYRRSGRACGKIDRESKSQ